MVERQFLCALVNELKRGSQVQIDARELHKSVAPIPGWNRIDRFIEGIAGFCHEFTCRYDEQHQAYVFTRLTEAEVESLALRHLRTYVAPDRRHLFRQVENGMWELLPRKGFRAAIENP